MTLGCDEILVSRNKMKTKFFCKIMTEIYLWLFTWTCVDGLCVYAKFGCLVLLFLATTCSYNWYRKLRIHIWKEVATKEAEDRRRIARGKSSFQLGISWFCKKLYSPVQKYRRSMFHTRRRLIMQSKPYLHSQPFDFLRIFNFVTIP